MSDTPDVPQVPRWLSRKERAAWMGLTGILARLPGALDAQLERDAGVTYFEYMVLAMLSEHAHPSSAHRKPRRESFDRGSAATLVSWRHTCPQPVQR